MAESRRNQPSPQQPIPESWLIFKGTVQETGAATMAGVPVTERTAVVVVDEVLHTPATLADQTGRAITVELSPGAEARRGLEAVFFTEGWLYGEGLAVREMRRSDAAGAKRLATRITNTMRTDKERALAERVTTADVVVVGQVTIIRKAEPHDVAVRRRSPISEHDPDWWEAVIAVREVLRGKLDAPVALVLFPMSVDVMWFQAPKFQARQEGVWLLRWTAIPELGRRELTALEPIDHQPLDARDAVAGRAD